SDDVTGDGAGFDSDGTRHGTGQRAICAAGPGHYWGAARVGCSDCVPGTRGVFDRARAQAIGVEWAGGGAIMRRLNLGLALLTAVLAIPAHAQTPTNAAPAQSQATTQAPRQPLTLEQAEALALRNNPQITIGKLRALEAQQGVREARSALLPTGYLSVTGVDSEAGSRVAAGSLNNPGIFPRAAAGATRSPL